MAALVVVVVVVVGLSLAARGYYLFRVARARARKRWSRKSRNWPRTKLGGGNLSHAFNPKSGLLAAAAANEKAEETATLLEWKRAEENVILITFISHTRKRACRNSSSSGSIGIGSGFTTQRDFVAISHTSTPS